MILKQHLTISKKQYFSSKWKWILLAATLFLVVLFFIVYYILVEHVLFVPVQSRIADAEEVSNELFLCDGFYTSGVENRSDEMAFEGKYSLKLAAPDNQYGFEYEVTGVRQGDKLEAAVWVYSTNDELGKLAILSEDKKTTYAESISYKKSKNNWRLILVEYTITDTLDKIYKVVCYNNNTTPAFFDNMSFAQISQNKSTWAPEKIQLDLGGSEYATLLKKREEALERGILITEDNSWVKGVIGAKNKDEKDINVSLRLKGDWLDHLEGNKWSFRVKTASDKSWNRMKVFSLQDPKSRGYLNEWVLHKLFEKEDILTPRYEFVNLILNRRDMGLYVYEEHFTKQLLEFKKRKEGPIVKFSETYFWESHLQAMQEGADTSKLTHTFSPNIEVFEESLTAENPVLAMHFATAQNLMLEYQYGLKPAKEIFSLDALAKYYAIVDVTGGHHGVIWHNQRFYYNPIISKLEPIGFDGYGNVSSSWVKTAFLGEDMAVKTGDKEWHKKLFADVDFLKKYIYYLDKYSKDSYITTFVKSMEEDITARVAYVQQSIHYYRHSNNYLYQRAANIRNALKPQSSVLQTKTIKPGEIAVCNRHKTMLELVGTTTSKNSKPVLFDSTQFVYTTPSQGLPDYSHQLKVPVDAKFLVYRVIGLEELYYTEISQWPIPEAFAAAQELQPNLRENHPAYYYDKENKKVIFKKEALVSEPIIIPANHRVLIEGGTTIDMTQKAFFVSYSIVNFEGSKELPIHVTSTDNTSMGWIVLNAPGRSTINFTTFSNLNTLGYKGWIQTGAVSYYQTDVDIFNSVFTKNHCEDALNVIRANFTFDHSVVSHTFGDGFDADFCTGVVSNSYFHDTGNDCIDFSTSVITIKDCRMKNSGDKGISIGEAGTATVDNVQIDGAVIGIASKDLSKVTVSNTTLKNCQIGFSAYQKKPEYGGGFLYVKSYTGEQLKVVHRIDPGSYMDLMGVDIRGY